MFRTVLDEMRRRRLLPVAALAVLVAIIAPLLFLKGAPDDAPSANAAAPAAAEPAKLPARAARLLAANDGDASDGATKGSAQDPFAPPASYLRTANAAATGGGTSKTPAKTSGGKSTITSAPAVVPGTPSAPNTPKSTTSRRATPTINAANAAVDIRFGPKAETKIRRTIPRQKAFYIHGKLVAVFVKYSPSRKAAVFALAPGLHITGDIKCRVVNGSCRYLDIPAGAHAWITTITPSRTVVKRRLDVVRIKRRSASSSTRARSASARREASCLARKLLAMQLGDEMLTRDDCQRS